MISIIKDEVTKMKECLPRPEENFVEPNRVEPECTAAVDQSIQRALVDVDKIQEVELQKQKTVFKKMMSNIKDEMTEMKECVLGRLSRHEENIEESFSGCTAALEQSIQEALVWATPPKEDHAGIKDPGESPKCKDFI